MYYFFSFRVLWLSDEICFSGKKSELSSAVISSLRGFLLLLLTLPLSQPLSLHSTVSLTRPPPP